MRKLLAAAAILAATIGFGSTAEAYPTGCTVSAGRYQAIAYCSGGTGVYRVGATARGYNLPLRYIYGPFRYPGTSSVVSAPAGYYIVSAWVQR
jgi:hypothetical protein